MEIGYPKIIFLTVSFILVAGCLGQGDKEDQSAIESEAQGELISQPMGLDEGQTGTMSIPYIGVNFVELDVKHHWDMPINVTGVRVNVSWSGASWDVELSIGTGDCPHSGMMLNSTQGGGGQLSTEYWVGEGGSLESMQWFCHIALPDANSHRGESINYVFEVMLFAYEEIDCEGDVCPV